MARSGVVPVTHVIIVKFDFRPTKSSRRGTVDFADARTIQRSKACHLCVHS